MQKKSIFTILGVMLAVVVTSLALVFTVGPKLDAARLHSPILEISDEDDFIVDENGDLLSFSDDVKEKIANCFDAVLTGNFKPTKDYSEIHIYFPEKVISITSNMNLFYATHHSSNGYGEYYDYSSFFGSLVTKLVLRPSLEKIAGNTFAWFNEAEIVIAPDVHYHLVGWYYDEQFTEPYDTGNMPFTDAYDYSSRLYAKWEIDKCTVNFLNYKGDHVPNQQIDYGSCAVEPTPTCEGYTFLGWYNLANDQKFDFNTPITYDMQLYAKWRDNSKPEEDPTQPENNETPNNVVENKNNGVIGWVIGLVLAGVGAAGTVAGVVVAKKRRK